MTACDGIGSLCAFYIVLCSNKSIFSSCCVQVKSKRREENFASSLPVSAACFRQQQGTGRTVTTKHNMADVLES